MNEFSGFGCLSLICLAPFVAFALGVVVGKNKLPYRVRIEKTGTAIEKYEVDDGAAEWQ